MSAEIDLIGLCGQIRAMQSKLLTINRLDRMIGAPSAESAFHVFSQLQYSEYLDGNVRAENFLEIIQQGLLETKKLIERGAENHPGLDFFFLRFDLNNLKNALKLKLIEGATEIKKDEFCENNGFEILGNLSREEINLVIFRNKKIGSVPAPILEAIDKAQANFEVSGEGRAIDFALDRAHFVHLHQILLDCPDPFLSELFGFIVDSINFRSAARSILTLGEAVPEDAWIEFGGLNFRGKSAPASIADLKKVAQTSRFRAAGEAIDENASPEKNIEILEKGIDRAYRDFVGLEAAGELDSIRVPLQYFAARLSNAKMIKLIMFAKFQNRPPAEIYKLLPHF